MELDDFYKSVDKDLCNLITLVANYKTKDSKANYFKTNGVLVRLGILRRSFELFITSLSNANSKILFPMLIWSVISFLENKVQITSYVSPKEYSQDDILSITYKDDETNDVNIGIASGTIGEAFYIYRNDGEINGFIRSDVDSIAYSRYDADSIIIHNKI